MSENDIKDTRAFLEALRETLKLMKKTDDYLGDICDLRERAFNEEIVSGKIRSTDELERIYRKRKRTYERLNAMMPKFDAVIREVFEIFGIKPIYLWEGLLKHSFVKTEDLYTIVLPALRDNKKVYVFVSYRDIKVTEPYLAIDEKFRACNMEPEPVITI